MGAERRGDLRCSMSSRARMIPAPPRRFRPMPGWAAARCPARRRRCAICGRRSAGGAAPDCARLASAQHVMAAAPRAQRRAAVLAGHGGRLSSPRSTTSETSAQSIRTAGKNNGPTADRDRPPGPSRQIRCGMIPSPAKRFRRLGGVELGGQ
jgi:hypothetical protein